MLKMAFGLFNALLEALVPTQTGLTLGADSVTDPCRITNKFHLVILSIMSQMQLMGSYVIQAERNHEMGSDKRLQGTLFERHIVKWLGPSIEDELSCTIRDCWL